MRKLILGLVLVFVMAIAIAPVAAQDATIADIVVASANGRNPEFTTLLAALQVAGLAEALDGEGPFTVFAPTDAAFAAIDPAVLASLIANPDVLSQVLLYHVVPGRFAAADVVTLDNQFVTTLQGSPLLVQVRDGNVLIDVTSTVIQTDIEASNGIIHVIDVVLVPPTDLGDEDLYVITGDTFAYDAPGSGNVVGPVARCQTFFMGEYAQGFYLANGIFGWVDERLVLDVPETYGQPGADLLPGC